GQPFERELPDAVGLRGVDGLGRCAERERRAGLDLDEHQLVPVAGDDVELARAAAPVAVEHHQPSRLEMSGGEPLAVPADRVLDPHDAHRARSGPRPGADDRRLWTAPSRWHDAPKEHAGPGPAPDQPRTNPGPTA